MEDDPKKKWKTTSNKIFKKMEDDLKKMREKKWKATLKKWEKMEDNLEKMRKKMEDDLKKNKKMSAKINLIGCDTIVNSPSFYIFLLGLLFSQNRSSKGSEILHEVLTHTKFRFEVKTKVLRTG
jgi:predicted phosphoadenosine phosphosulfate sulfurtransferase